jgi:hypothetical protein
MESVGLAAPRAQFWGDAFYQKQPFSSFAAKHLCRKEENVIKQPMGKVHLAPPGRDFAQNQEII